MHIYTHTPYQSFVELEKIFEQFVEQVKEFLFEYENIFMEDLGLSVLTHINTIIEEATSSAPRYDVWDHHI